MRKILTAVITLLFAVVPAQSLLAAKPNFVTKIVAPSGQEVLIPETAVEVAPHVFSLGYAFDVSSGKVVQGYAFVTPKEGFGHRPNHGGGKPDGGGGSSSCYSYTGRGAKWKSSEPWVVNPANTAGLNGSFVLAELTNGVNQWEDAADGNLNGSGVNIFGDGSQTSDALTADTVSTDGVNEVLFGSIDSQGAIAVTIVWGIFGGPPQNRELVEWDMVFDQEDFSWSEDASLNPTAMDFTNIAVHELGHAFGLNHPEDSCAEETMYRFAAEGETKKRDLHTGDIAGIDGLY